MLQQQQQEVDQDKQECEAPWGSGECETPNEKPPAAVGSKRKAPEGHLQHHEHKQRKQVGTTSPAGFTGPPGILQRNRGTPPAMLAELKEWVWAAVELSEGRPLELAEVAKNDSLKPCKKVQLKGGCVGGRGHMWHLLALLTPV